MSSWLNRTVLSGSSVSKNGTNSHTCTFTAATAGNFLVAVVAGGVTSTTPSGWTLLVSAVNNSGLYVFTKTASASEASFSTTHNGSNYAIKGVVYEFLGGTSAIGSNSATGQAANTVVTGPSVSSLTGTYSRFAARSYGHDGSSSSSSVSWTLPTVEDYDDYINRGVGVEDGVELSIAYDDSSTGASFNPSSNLTTVSDGVASGEGVAWALTFSNTATAITAWLVF
jgi:hypothetical protein